MRNKQGKVSMVMPCYNKERHIAPMLDSVISQSWNNIELVLVNDGSTDGTRQVIADYQKSILARGFEIVIIDQGNAGVCAAARVGLEQAGGDYICLVDSDDELDPESRSQNYQRQLCWRDSSDTCARDR